MLLSRSACASLALAIASAPLTAVPAMAAAAPSERVQINDLDLASPAGNLEFERRVAAAARKLCARDASGGVRRITSSCKAAVQLEASDKVLARLPTPTTVAKR